MGQMDKNMDSIMELFFEFPNERLTIRQIAKKTRIPKSTVHKYLVKLKSAGLINKDNLASDTRLFKIKKIHYFIEKIYSSGLIEQLNRFYAPSCIILFGSFRKGDSASGSDIDLFLETTKKEDASLKEFEEKLRHKIQIFREASINKLPLKLFNNVVNGIKLEGFFKIR